MVTRARSAFQHITVWVFLIWLSPLEGLTPPPSLFDHMTINEWTVIKSVQLSSHCFSHPGSTYHGVKADVVYRCETCQQTFANQSNLKIHEKHVHSSERLFPCDHCEKTFKRKKDVVRHQKQVRSVGNSHTVSAVLNGKALKRSSAPLLHVRSTNAAACSTSAPTAESRSAPKRPWCCIRGRTRARGLTSAPTVRPGSPRILHSRCTAGTEVIREEGSGVSQAELMRVCVTCKGSTLGRSLLRATSARPASRRSTCWPITSDPTQVEEISPLLWCGGD